MIPRINRVRYIHNAVRYRRHGLVPLTALRFELLRDFAETNEWNLGESFTLSQLASAKPGGYYEPHAKLDLINLEAPCTGFLWRSGERRDAIRSWPVAIVLQHFLGSPNIEKKVADLIRGHGLELHEPPCRLASFRFPGRCTFNVITQPRTPVAYLPEQIEFGILFEKGALG